MTNILKCKQIQIFFLLAELRRYKLILPYSCFLTEQAPWTNVILKDARKGMKHLPAGVQLRRSSSRNISYHAEQCWAVQDMVQASLSPQSQTMNWHEVLIVENHVHKLWCLTQNTSSKCSCPFSLCSDCMFRRVVRYVVYFNILLPLISLFLPDWFYLHGCIQPL